MNLHFFCFNTESFNRIFKKVHPSRNCIKKKWNNVKTLNIEKQFFVIQVYLLSSCFKNYTRFKEAKNDYKT